MRKSFNGAFRLVAAAALSLALAVAPVAAQESVQELAPDHVALARKYVDLTDRSAVYETALVNVGIETLRTLISQNPELLKPADEVIAKILEEYRPKKDELLNEFARRYAQAFSVEELTQIVAFYESPVGTKLAQTNASINEDLQKILQVFENNLRVEFFAKVRAGLKEKGIEL